MEKEEIASHLKEHILAKMDQGERFYIPENLNFGLSSSDSERFVPQIGAFSGEMRDKKPLMREKRRQDASKCSEDEGVKPKVQVESSLASLSAQASVKTRQKAEPQQPVALHKKTIPPVQCDDLSDMKALLQKITPAKCFKEPTTPVVFITDDMRPQVIAFLTKVGEATRPLFGDFSIVLIEQFTSLSSPALKLIVAPATICSKLFQGEVSKIPLIKTEPFAVYLDHPEKKRPLWDALRAAAQ